MTERVKTLLEGTKLEFHPQIDGTWLVAISTRPIGTLEQEESLWYFYPRFSLKKESIGRKKLNAAFWDIVPWAIENDLKVESD